ncbi:MAG: hypothetical protein KJ710_06875 [Candidatus Omnitrophica bacterium]|nr:hypothetical protein [Candidatus Omnitrophota bacterium]MBU1923957.1 hypothetical protein [Candidatus Omnitrophota bacterium]
MRFFTKNKSGLLILDLAVSLTVIWFLIWIFGGVIGTLAQNSREVALRYQLNNFRMLIVLYKELKGHYPEDLKVLIQSSHRLSNADEIIFNEKFLGSLEQDEHGTPLDAFSNRLYYDSWKGVVGSTTKGYENW